MNSNKSIKINSLKGVENTLLLPLYSRALDCKSKTPILNDITSLEITERIDFDFEIFSRYLNDFAILGHSLRSRYFDLKVEEFLNKFPNGKIVSLGSGFDDRFKRIDNGKVIFFDIDLPDVIQLRKEVLNENERNIFISSSILDQNWFNKIKNFYKNDNEPLFIIAEAVFVYIPKPEIMTLIQCIVDTFPNCEFVFDIYSNFMVKQSKQEKILSLYKSEFKWGVKNSKEIETLIPKLKLLCEWSFFDTPETHKGRFKILRFFPFIRNMSKIAHYKSVFVK